MSFPYHQYVEYSNPATPRVYAWEVASATSDQDPTLQLQQQQQQQPPQDPQAHAQISPSQLQLQQLPPLPQHAQPSTPQEHQLQLQQLQQQPQQRQQYTAAHQTIHVQPPAASMPGPQYRFETVTEEDFIQASATGERPGSGSSRPRRGASKPPLHVDTSSSRRASSSAAASPGAGSASGTGGRVPHARTHAHSQSAHPYRRPQSVRSASGGSASDAGAAASAATAAGPSGQQQAPVRSRHVSEHLQSAQTSVGGVSTSHTGGALPTVGTPMGVSCPASSRWREGLLGLSTAAQGQTAGTSFGVDAAPGSVASASATPRGQTNALPMPPPSIILPFPLEPPVKRYGIRADIHFSADENVITVMFELPGVKRDDLRITIGALPIQGHQVRERKFGEFFRTLAVPPETKPEDISVNLEDGILTMKIPGGAPAQAEQPQEIPIPAPDRQ